MFSPFVHQFDHMHRRQHNNKYINLIVRASIIIAMRLSLLTREGGVNLSLRNELV